MATVTALLRSELMSALFTNAVKAKALIDYTGPGIPTINGEGENSMDIDMNISETATTNNDIVASFNNPLGSENFILVRIPSGYASGEVKKIQFINQAEDTVYFEWVFSAGEVVYTGNGELHLEEINFKVA